MSTRCQIGIYESNNQPIDKPEVLLYRHSDSYPGKEDESEYGVLPDIVPFLRWWAKGRGIWDSEYLGARLLQHLCNLYDNRSNKYEEEIIFTGIYGYGICKDFHGDIEYLYRIYPNVLEVYECGFDKEPKDFKLIETIELKEVK